jgi:hypothetical protein
MAQNINQLLALLGLTGQPAPGANDPAELFGLQGGFGDEAASRAIMAERAGAPPNVASSYNRDANRWKQAQGITYAGMQPTPQMQELNSAVSEGFGTGPQSPVQDVDPVRSRNIYRRQQVREKMRQPIEQEEVQNAGDIARQKLVNQGALDLAKENNAAFADRNTQYNELLNLMQQQGATPVQRATLPGKSGGGSIGLQAPRPQIAQAGQLNQLAVIRGNLAKAGITNPFQNFANPTTQDEANFVQGVNGLISQAPLDGSIKQGIIGYLRDPESNQLPIEELFDLSQATPAERTALVNLFTQIRGY